MSLISRCCQQIAQMIPRAILNMKMCRHRGIMICLVITTALLAACRPEQNPKMMEESDEPTVTPPLPISAVMAWGGISVVGYVRVELWSSQSQLRPRMTDLVISRTDGSVHRFHGRMIAIPDDLVATQDQWRAFVITPEESAAYRNVIPDILATVSPTGSLRLYEFSTRTGIGAFDLQPLK